MTNLDDDMRAVLASLRAARRKVTAEQVAAATGFSAAVVDRALQALLLRRLIVCDSFSPPGRGGQIARWIGSSKEPLWAAAWDDEGDDR